MGEQNKTIQKPTSVVRMEFMEGVVALVNNSGLPFFVMEPILKDLYLSVKNEADRVYQLEKKAYEESVKNSNEKEVG